MRASRHHLPPSLLRVDASDDAAILEEPHLFADMQIRVDAGVGGRSGNGAERVSPPVRERDLVAGIIDRTDATDDLLRAGSGQTRHQAAAAAITIVFIWAILESSAFARSGKRGS